MLSLTDREQHMIEKIRRLPLAQLSAIENLIDALTQPPPAEPTTLEAMQLSEPAFAKIWNNPEDAEYDNL